MFKVNNRNTRTRCEIRSKLTIKTTEQRHLGHSGVFSVNFEHISNLVLARECRLGMRCEELTNRYVFPFLENPEEFLADIIV